MQYLLTQIELDHLHEAAKLAANRNRAAMQTLCTEVANLRPVTVEWRKDEPPRPWGCILNERNETNPGYCDECPVQKLCPYEGKEWSK